MSPSDCSVASLAVGESLHGTAVESVDRWLLLEVPHPWASKALQTETLSPAVRARLHTWLESPRSRLQLVRRPGRVGTHPWFAAVSSAPDRQGISKLDLDRYEDLLDVDLDAMPMEPAAPMCLVCVHGRRDRCCAVHGSAVFRALHSRGVDVWQTTHLGGHRFAACVLSLPDGLMYGRVRPEHADAVAAAHRAGEIGDLSLLRGRCAYDRPTQAAEAFLRRALGNACLGPVEWLATSSEGDSMWRVTFRADGKNHVLGVGLEETGQQRPASCGGAPEAVTRWVERRPDP